MKKALLIGINYIGTIHQLNGCINDINNLRNILMKNNYFSQTHITLMDDERNTQTNNLYPSKNNILKQMGEMVIFANQCASNGQKCYLFLAFSGHGSYVRDTNGDEIDGRDEVICPADFSTSGFIVDDYIRSNFIDKLGSNTTIFIMFDSCHSGTATDLKYSYKCDSKNTYTSHSKLSDTSCNVIMISGCSDNQTSADAYIPSSKTFQGAMTASFLSNYTHGISCKNLINKMRSWLKSGKYSQIPQLGSGKFINVDKPVLLSSYSSTTETQTHTQTQTQSVDVSKILKHIKSVKYGKNKFKDVTSKFKKYFSVKRLEMVVSNTIFGDPQRGIVKNLVITLSNKKVLKFREGSKLSLDKTLIVKKI